jgi:hypothetical protein
MTAWLFATLLLATQQEPLPVPDEQAQQGALKTIREVFKEEFAKKTPAERLALARKLLQQSADPGTDAASRYVLLREALGIATATPDVDVAKEALGQLASAFKLDALALKASSYTELGKSVKSPEAIQALAKAWLALADEALKADDATASAAAAQAAGAQARRAKEAALAAAADAKAKEIAARKIHLEKVRKAIEALAKDPADAAANQAVGEYRAWIKGDWAAGADCLAKGLEGPSKSLAIRDMAPPQNAQEQLALADGWWDFAEGSAAPYKDAIRDRALVWYMKVLPDLQGLVKARPEKRIAQRNTERFAKGTWVDYGDPANFGLRGKAGETIELTRTNDVYQVPSKGFPPGTFNAVSVRIRFKGGKGDGWFGYGGLPQNEHHMCSLSPDQGRFLGSTLAPTGNIILGETPLPVRDEYVLLVSATEDEYVLYLDYIEVRRVKNASPKIEWLFLWANKGTVQFDRIRIRRKD